MKVSDTYDGGGVYLVEVIQSCVQVGVHARRRLIRDLDGIF